MNSEASDLRRIAARIEPSRFRIANHSSHDTATR
jgi:hypothetical protein